MIIKFYCNNNHWFFKTDIELREEKHSHRFCWCGEKLHIEQQSLENIIAFDIEERIKANINQWAKNLGIEGMLELIERNKDQATYRLYKTELQKMGLILK